MMHFMKSSQKGAATSLHCATDESLSNVTGKYYEESAERTPSKPARDLLLADELWTGSCEMVGVEDPLPRPRSDPL